MFDGAAAAVARISPSTQAPPSDGDRGDEGRFAAILFELSLIGTLDDPLNREDFDDKANLQLFCGPGCRCRCLPSKKRNATCSPCPGVGESILEISHRSKPFDAIINGAEADIRKLAGIPDNYYVLLLQGGASLQFSMVPLNPAASAGKADYIITGIWSKKAMKEAQKVGQVNIAASTEAENFARIPDAGRAQAHARSRVCALHYQQHDSRH